MTRWLTILLLLSITTPLLAQGKGKKKAANEAATARAADDEADDANIPRIVPVFDPGSHTRSIRAIGFNHDQSRLITVGLDFSVQIWSTATGERLDILRLPSYGHEQGYNTKEWNAAAISADGRWVAVGGGQKKGLSTDKESLRAKMVIIDLARRSMRPVAVNNGAVTALGFAPDNRLAVSQHVSPKHWEIAIYPPPNQARGNFVPRTGVTVIPLDDLTRDEKGTGNRERNEVSREIEVLQFSPDGQRLCATAPNKTFLWDLKPAEPKLITKLEPRGATTCMAWSPDGQHFVRCWNAFLGDPKGLELRKANGELEWEYLFTDETPPFRSACSVRSAVYLDPQTLLLTTNYGLQQGDLASTAIRFDLKTKSPKLVRTVGEPGQFHVYGALSPKRDIASITVSSGLDTIVYRVKDGTEVARCGAASPVPTLVGWSKDVASPAIAWSEASPPNRFNTQPDDMRFAFDLKEMQPVSDVNPADFGVALRSIRDWKFTRPTGNSLAILQGDQQSAVVQGGTKVSAGTLIPRGEEPPWMAWSANLTQRGYSTVRIVRHDGRPVAQLRPNPVFCRDLVTSPDGRFVLVSTGTHRLGIYAVGGEPFPLLSLARVNGEWVAWSANGYYAASPGGEKMFGWSESHGLNQFATFHPAEKFAKHFRRPDLLKRAIELGSMEAALKQGEVRAPVIEDVLPPKCELKLIKQTGGKVLVLAVATSSVKEKPVLSMRLLLDGRPLAGGVGQNTVAAGEKAEATWELDIPAGPHELKLLARNDDSSAVSEPLIVTGPKSASQQPTLHRLCVGINEYQLSAFNLGAAVKDAADVFTALETHCVGAENRFGTAKGILLTNKQATRAGVMKAISDIRNAAKPGDLVVFLFAGHGVKQQDEFYLMTHEADPNASLKGTSLSGEDLRTALSDMECPVLLIMDACHSARGVKAFRPATDDLTRSLTDDTAGVTVLAAAMAHEVAAATEENGYFTAALLKALQVGQGVPYDPHEHVLYTHHIYSVIFSEVRKASNGKQNPFLNMPWTVPPLIVREVAH